MALFHCGEHLMFVYNLRLYFIFTVPFFNTLANGAGAMPLQTNYMNHLAATMNNNPTTQSAVPALPNTHTTQTTANNFNSTKNSSKTTRRNPEPPPPPRLSSASPIRTHVKPNQGTAPMDLENDLENETPTSTAPAVATSSDVASKTSTDKMPLNMPDANLYLNSLMASQMCGNAGFMFFPTNAAAAGAAGGNSLMDPSAMMAAMQQMQQYGGYGNGSLTDPTSAMDPSKVQQTNQTGLYVVIFQKI